MLGLSIGVKRSNLGILGGSESIDLGISRLLESGESSSELSGHGCFGSSCLFLSKVDKVIAIVGKGKSEVVNLVVEESVSIPEWLVKLIGEL